MDAFDGLSPMVQHGIVNDLQWPGLRLIQRRSIGPVLAGENVLLRAPTAGGKTEAAFFPLLSRLEVERWRGLSVLYLSPIRALVNNQAERLQRMCRWVGAEAAIWHGDTAAAARNRIRRSPPEVLLTTPESIEGMLCSRLGEPHLFFAGVQAVVIDEAHAFAAGDRGWHLRVVLERLASLAGRDIQRIGLSATVGNLPEVLDFLAGRSTRPRQFVQDETPGPTPDVRLDAVDDVDQATRLVSQLYRGEKRLVFTDSRRRCERIGEGLRAAGLRVHVTHSSLSADERRVAERAFAEEQDCVIVSTSALELGIDIGDLDRVIQLGAPSTVASFLQRMGRTGRRPGTRPGTLLITFDDAGLLKAAALLMAWRVGYVEDVRCPPAPWHILVQQALATLLQHGSRPLATWLGFVHVVAGLLHIDAADADAIAAHLLAEDWVAQSDGQVHIGPRAERDLGRRHFMELLSVFSSPPAFTLQHGMKVLGEVHEQTFWGRVWHDGSTVLSLGGRGWRVQHLDVRKRIAYVTPTGDRGSSRWVGGGAWVPAPVAAFTRQLFDDPLALDVCLTKRSRMALADVLAAHAHLAGDDLVLEKHPDGTQRLWTFAGTGINRALARRLRACLPRAVSGEDLFVEVHFAAEDAATDALLHAVERLQGGYEPEGSAGDYSDVVQEKFAECLPLAMRTAQSRRREVPAAEVGAALARSVRVVTLAEGD
ncbi:MAG: DEAD/DEAH box helicase [Myxococcales bacterium]|nr:DEAD/DEAH box helicase [Myxococcales bacterium]MCB9544265.1 DEAD/DEAH box helicase [Myxococcales bacterium]